MLPKLNRRRARFVLTKIDKILAWEKRNEAEKDIRFVDLGRYLCEVRAGKEEEPSEIIYFKIYKSQIPVIEQAIDTAALMLGRAAVATA